MGYRVMAALSATGGLACHTADRAEAEPGHAVAREHRELDLARKFREFLRNPLFLLLFAGMFLVNIPQALFASQLILMLMENGATMAYATCCCRSIRSGVVIGRFGSGWSLDRVPPHLVAIVMLGLPSIGYLALASSFDARWVLAGAVVLVGLAQGAETDVSAYPHLAQIRAGAFFLRLLDADDGHGRSPPRSVPAG